jgi:hypothetical protein
MSPRARSDAEIEIFCDYETRNRMSFKSAFEDLSQTTLEAVSGCLRKLEYLAGLKRWGNEYWHWGFAKVHGQPAAKRALRDAHGAVVSEVLQTPLKVLLEDVEMNSGDTDPERYLEELRKKEKDLLPADPGAGSARHLSSVLHALWRLERNRQRSATRQAS